MDKALDIDITPDKSLIQKLGLVGYRTEQAIAELVDNSIDARLNGKTERIVVYLNFEDRWIYVRDDGIGMDRQDLTNAMTIAKGTKTDEKLGKFGIGMKSACSTLGKQFQIVTAKLGSRKEYLLTYDEDQWLSNDNLTWKNFKILEKDLKEEQQWHGTIITISKLKVPLYPMQVTKFKENFGIRYAPYIESGQVTLKINTTFCRPQEPDIVKGSRRDIVIHLRSGATITGYIALLEKRSIKGNYGIHLFKNNRLIKAFEKFGFQHHPENARIIGKLNLDHVPVNFHKSAFLEDSLEYEEAQYAFSHDPVVMQTIKEARAGAAKEISVDAIFKYVAGEALPESLDTRIRSSTAKEVINAAEDFDVMIGDKPLSVSFADQGDYLYSINPSEEGIRLVINRRNEAFNYVKNPLFLIGLIAVEAKMILADPRYSDFAEKRNSALNAFINDWRAKEGKDQEREREKRLLPMKDYGLSPDLIEVHDKLLEEYDGKFQFTSLATLSSYLNNALGRIVYTIHTTPGKGLYLADVITKNFQNDFLVMADPKPLELQVAIDVSKSSKIIVVREYAEIIGETYASPDKAWVDLVNDVFTHKIPLDSSELANILSALSRKKMVVKEKIEQRLRHAKKIDKVQEILESVFG